MPDTKQMQDILALARQSIANRFNGPAPVVPSDPLYKEKHGVFVSLHKKGELRGCIGYIKGYKALGDSIIEMAQAAAFRDPRFPALRADELEQIKLEISILGELIPIKGTDAIEIGRDGLFIDHPQGSGLLLPQVATEWQWTAPVFMEQVCRKAGLSRTAWMDEEARLYRFEAAVFSED